MTGFGGLIGLDSVDAKDGTATLQVEAGEQHLNGAGTVHGGFLATLCDSAMGAAVRSTTDDADIPATSQLSIAYLRPGRPGPLTVTGRVSKQGEHLLVCEADIEQEGKALVHSVATFALVERH
jgi:uncharacterized protein (TIGR00369 family)